MTRPNKQLGIALMTVLLILAIASVAAVSMSSSRQLDIRRTENLVRAEQAWEYLYSLESWAADVLREGGMENKVDGFDDQWHKPLAETKIQGGTLQAQLTDLQGRFNLNNLIVDNKPSDLDIQRFKRLLALLKIKPELSDAVLDWIDADAEIRYPSGAEDETYLRQKPPYRSANGKFSDVSELLLVYGITEEIVQKLKPYVYVASTYAPININTADPLLIRSLVDKLKEDKAESLLRDRKDEAFAKIEDFIKHKAFAELLITRDGLAVTSEHFLLSGSVVVGRVALAFESQLERSKDTKAKVVKRMRTGLANG